MAIFKAAEPKSQQTIHVAIMVDTQAIIRNHQINATNVIFMMDDNGTGSPPSLNEGSYELKTVCSPGDQISWRAFSINGNDRISFTFFHEQGDRVFGNYPPSGNKSEYLATVLTTGTDTYQVGILINEMVPYSWDPYIYSQPATRKAGA